MFELNGGEEFSRIFLGICTPSKKKKDEKEETNSAKHSNVEFRKRMRLIYKEVHRNVEAVPKLKMAAETLR